MDDKVTAVLDAYHQRMRDEEKSRRESPPPRVRTTGSIDLCSPSGPTSGRLINILARSLNAPRILELGTSFGYSGIWLAGPRAASGGRLTRSSWHSTQSSYRADDMATKAGLVDFVDFRVGDAVKMIAELSFGVRISCWSIFGRNSMCRASTRSTPSSTPVRSSSPTT